jgi:tetratricopeptide (TPR) repeat protein
MFKLVKHWQKRNLDILLSGLQLGCFIGAFALLIVSALMYRHYTDNALMQVWDFLASVKIAIPPIAVLGATYFYAFVTGEPLANAPKNIWRWLRDTALQDNSFMVSFLLLVTVICISAGVFLNTQTPPSYERLVSQLLGGENDDHEIISATLKQLKEKNQLLAKRIETVRNVFDERRKWNNENKQISATLPRIFIRSLEANIDDKNWLNHPLRLHAAAEAHSMLAQSLSIRPESAKSPLVAENRDQAIRLYRAVAQSTSPWATKLMRRSAEQNIGNAYYYASDYSAALREYELVSAASLSSGVEANRVAALIQLQRIPDAVVVGNKAISVARSKGTVLSELRDYISLVTNVGFAKLILKKPIDALENMQEAYDLLPDAMARQNLALALDASDKPDEAVSLLAEDIEAPIVTPDSELDIISKHGGGSCTYIIRATALLHLNGEPADVAANVAAYARQPQPKESLRVGLQQWRQLAMKTLVRDPRPCSGLQLLPSVMQQFN